MTKLFKMAILVSEDSDLTFELEEIQTFFSHAKIATKIFYVSDTILQYQPDCVIITSPQHAKLTPYPTYGLINKPRSEYLEIARFLRNVLTYDGYLTFSDRLKQFLGDILFGARKLNTSILKLDFFPTATEFKIPNIDVSDPKLIIFEPDFNYSKFKKSIFRLLNKFKNCSVVSFSIPKTRRYSKRFILARDTVNLRGILNDYAIAICLNSGDEQEKTLNPSVLKLISSCAITIAHHTELLESYFQDNLYYIPADTSLNEIPKIIEFHLQQILTHPGKALKKCQMAHQIFLQSLAFDTLFTKFADFHQQSLIDKGYIPNPDANVERTLPSVSYIIRTGGKHRPFLERTLDCLVAQQYPDLRAILVIHAHFPYLNELKDKYKSLKIKVVESIKSRRSEAIRDGMAVVDTDLFGLFDDDDEIFPNHVRMLVKTLNYHANRDWRGEIAMVYSGSIHADDTYPVQERLEFQDHKLINKNEKRAIEHFKLYSSLLMSQHEWFMPNGWLARSKLIDEELLTDPELDTCEDLYFELQIAQRGHFAFSMEVTAVHHFHHLGNSTIDDSHKHVPDTQRIALRNFSRVFAPDALYDTHYNIIGRASPYHLNQIAYQDNTRTEFYTEYPDNAFYPCRNKGTVTHHTGIYTLPKTGFIKLPIQSLLLVFKFIRFKKYKRTYYINKFKSSVAQYGYLTTFKKVIAFANFNRK